MTETTSHGIAMTTLFDIDAHKGDIGGSTYTPYKFNGKELDDETGYYYYGACYRTPCAAGSMSLCL